MPECPNGDGELALSGTFLPRVPVFDGHVALGRRHDARVACGDPDALIRRLRQAGIQRALVYHPHAVHFDTLTGNRLLMSACADRPFLEPQWVVHLTLDQPVADLVGRDGARGVRSLRVTPNSHGYRLTQWILEPWVPWLRSQRLGLWIPMDEVDPTDLYDTVRAWPDIPIVLVGVHYSHQPMLCALVQELAQIYVDLSRYDVADGVVRLRDRVGAGRLLFGSQFPTLNPEPYLYYLHHAGLGEGELRRICHDNLQTLIEGEASG